MSRRIVSVKYLLLIPVFAVCAALAFTPAFAQDEQAAPKIHKAHAIAMNGAPKYKAGFEHFDYANPNAPKGGELRMGAIGSFDSFNPFIVKGVTPTGLGFIYDTLLTKSDDEAFTEYGLVAETLEWPEDRSWIIFHLRKEAKFHDGHPITAEDVEYSFKLITEQGSPLYKRYYKDVSKVEILDEHSIKFTFGGEVNKELPLILGQLQVLPKHFWESRDFTEASLEIPLGSGPYKIANFKPGHSIVYQRVDEYWGKDLPVNKGSYNFERIRYDFYRDQTVTLEAFKAGEFDFRRENISKSWSTAYTGPAFDEGLIIKESIPHENTQGMQGFVFNMRRPKFKDVRVREALALAFDFEWSNKNLFYGLYKRSESFFANSELASSGLPQGREKEILEKYRGQLPPEIFEKEYHAPKTDGSGNLRKNLRKALKLLKEAGYEMRDKKQVNKETGDPLEFEFLLVSPSFERVVLPYKKNLERIGVSASVRLVDEAQYMNRVRDYDFDVTVQVFGQSMSPGNEQRYFWSSEAADVPGTYNLMGLKNPVVDELIDLVITAPDREELVQRTRALDRVLLWQWFLVPHWHSGTYYVAYWDKFSRPDITPKYALNLTDWWVDPYKAQRLERRLKSMK